MDFIPRTDFPDTRKLTVIQSQTGSVLNIPREGGFMNRFYMELPEGTVAKEVKLEDLQETTRRIFHPYQIDFAETVWWSTYKVGQRHQRVQEVIGHARPNLYVVHSNLNYLLIISPYKSFYLIYSFGVLLII